MRGLAGAWLTHHAFRMLVHRRMLGRAYAGLMVVVILRGLGCMVYTVGIVVVMVAMAPRGRAPVGHIATGIKQVNGEDRAAGGRVAIHRASIGIAVNRETVGIVTGGCPCHRAGIAGRIIAGGRVGAVTINVQRIAGAEQEGQADGQQQVCKFKFHIGMYFEK